MLREIDELIWTLRRDGFVVSTAQAIDILRACDLVGFEDGERLRDGIAAVMVDRASDRARFRASFERFLRGVRPEAQDLFARLRARGFYDDELAVVRALFEAELLHHRSSIWGGSDLSLEHELASASMKRHLEGLTTSTQVGYFAQRVIDRFGVSHAESALPAWRAQLVGVFGERGELLAVALESELKRLRSYLRDRMEIRLRQTTNNDQASSSYLDVPWQNLDDTGALDVRRAVRELAHCLQGAARVRQRRATRGLVDARNTIRKSLRTFGVPFAPVRKKRRNDKPKLFVLYDISDSVRKASTFMLEFVVATRELFATSRSFAFIRDVVETTSLFTQSTTRHALSQIERGSVMFLGQTSSYSRAFSSFEKQFGQSLDRRVTLVILGDGRTNYASDGIDVLAKLQKRCAQTLWICPEPKANWSLGDNAMTRYATVVDQIMIAESGRELQTALREVVARQK